MVILRPTLKLASKMGIVLPVNQSASTNRLGDWYANAFQNGRQQLILCVSEKTLISVVLKAAPYADFPHRFSEALREVLQAISISDAMIEAEVKEMREISFGKANDRSITGYMKEFSLHLDHKLKYEYGRPLKSLLDCSLYLCEIPCVSRKPSWPKEAAKETFARL